MSLLGKLIKVAHKHPETREHLVPIIKQAIVFDTDEAMDKYLKAHPGADKAKHKVEEPEKAKEPEKAAKKWPAKAKTVMEKHSLTDDDADEVKAFKKAKPDKGKKLTPQELMRRFLQKAKPETKKRMKDMPIKDFMAMYNAIMADEEGEAKQASLAWMV